MEDYRQLRKLIRHSTTDAVLCYIRCSNISAETFDQVSKTSTGSSPLGLAIQHGHLRVVNELIKLGFDPNSPCRVNNAVLSPLSSACKYNKLDIVLSLLHDHGIDIDSFHTDGYTALVATIAYNWSEKNVDIVKTLVEAGASVNTSCRDGRTPLTTAIDKENIDVCNLISKGADVNAENISRKNRTPLMHALMIKGLADREMFQLWESGADINAAGEDNKSSLMYDIKVLDNNRIPHGMLFDHRTANIDVIGILVESGADINGSDTEGHSSLRYAINNRAGPDMIKLLIESGADVNALDIHKTSPLCYTINRHRFWDKQGHEEDTVKVLIQSGADVNLLDNDMTPPLIRAITNRMDISVTRLLLEYGADVNAADTDNKSSLRHAIIDSNAGIDVVRLLLDYGADANALDTKNKSPLLCALDTNYLYNSNDKTIEETVKVLVRYGADVNLLDNNQLSPLIHALLKNANIEVITLLVEAGADVNVLDKDLVSPIMQAVMESANIDVIRLLVESGANVNALDNNNKSALWYAIDNYRHVHSQKANSIVKVLIQSGANINVMDNSMISPLILAIRKGVDTCVTRLLVESGADVNAADSEGQSSLMHAIANTAVTDVFKWLVECGADVNVLDMNNISPLMCALKKDRDDVVCLLLESGANVNVVDKTQKSPLHYAVGNSRCDKVRTDIIQVLVDSGADVNIQDENGDSPLMYALKNDASVEVLLLLLESGVDVCARNKDNISPLSVIFKRFDEFKLKQKHDGEVVNLVKVFEEHAGDVKGHLVTLPDTRRIHDAFDVIRTLCTKGADIEARDETGNTVLHQVMTKIVLCSCAKCFNLVHFLIVKLNLSLWALNNANQTPCHCALTKTAFRREETREILKLCFKAGYTPDTEEMADVRHTEEESSTDIKRSDVTSLQYICCFSVRRALGRRLPTAVNSLPIPEKLKQRVKLTHVETTVETPENTTELQDYDEYEDYDDDDDDEY